MTIDPEPPPPELAQARERFLHMVSDLRPELHRYCARLTGSVIDGEDVVQDALAKALYALGMAPEVPPLKPWLFRIAHNTAIDFLRRYEHAHEELVGETPEVVEDTADPLALRIALASFQQLPVLQRSAVILKDVLGHSLEETAATIGTTVPAVKAALVRGRGKLKGLPAAPETTRSGLDPRERECLERYVSLFNAKDWDGVRALLVEECQLEMVSKATRRGKGVLEYYTRYQAQPDVRLVLGWLDGRPALGLLPKPNSPRPTNFVLVGWRDGKVATLRDYGHVPYIARDAAFEPDRAAGERTDR